MTEPRFLTVPEYAAIRRVSPGVVYRMVKRGELEVERLGRLVRVVYPASGEGAEADARRGIALPAEVGRTLHRPDARAGHRSGIEVGWMTFERYRAMLAEHGLRPFHREPWVNPRTGKVEPGVLGERPAMRWRVSRDEWDRLREYVELVTGPYTHASERMQAQLFGWPIDPDDVLPPNSIIFEPA